jgi:hypothetical protein
MNNVGSTTFRTATLFSSARQKPYKAALILAVCFFLCGGAKAAGSAGVRARILAAQQQEILANPLPTDLVAITSDQIPRTAGGLFTLSNWPFSPPLPPNCSADYPDAQFYWSSSLNMAFVDDSAASQQPSTKSPLSSLEVQEGGVTFGLMSLTSFTAEDFWLDPVGVTNAPASATATASFVIHAPQEGVLTCFMSRISWPEPTADGTGFLGPWPAKRMCPSPTCPPARASSLLLAPTARSMRPLA